MPRKPSADNAAKRISSNVRHTVGANVRNRRLTLGWSQQELADRFGVSRATVSQYEIGTGEINAGDLPRLAGILGIELADFFHAPPPVSAPSHSVLEKSTQNGTLPDDILSWILMQDYSTVEATPAALSPALEEPISTPNKTTFSINFKADTRIFVKSDNSVWITNYLQTTIKEIGLLASDAKLPVVTDLLGSILILSPADHETLRQVVDAMQVRLQRKLDQADGDNK